MSKRLYTSHETVYVGDEEFTVDYYDEGAFWNPETLAVDIPGYVLYATGRGDYYRESPRTAVPVNKVHHLPLSERLIRIEERLELDNE